MAVPGERGVAWRGARGAEGDNRKQKGPLNRNFLELWYSSHSQPSTVPTWALANGPDMPR